MEKRKKILVSSVLLLIVVFSILILFQTVLKNKQKEEAYKSIPPFSLSDIDGNQITAKTLKKNTSILFLFFNTECELCHSELDRINTNQKYLNECQMIFFSMQQADTIRNFLKNIEFDRTSNMFFLVDEKAELIKTMEIQSTPTAIIYDKNGNLSKRFNGPAKVETLIKYLSE
ncbi:MAG: redoxin family protein [Dysgonamonadaceae bacterium]|jgi:cytochrome oxidase Cu insertion factor (SCO1/SenC/PrrC family)|nr:redoxin family protein [Dysgonamonadaceae bacterium]